MLGRAPSSSDRPLRLLTRRKSRRIFGHSYLLCGEKLSFAETYDAQERVMPPSRVRCRPLKTLLPPKPIGLRGLEADQPGEASALLLFVLEVQK